MGTTTKILVAANSPGTLHRLEATLSGLDVHVAIRLRDVAKAVKQGDFALLVLCLGFDEQSAVELVQSLRGERGATHPPVVAVACGDSRLVSPQTERRFRDAGACDFLELAAYPPGASNGELRRRILASAGVSAPTGATPVSRTLHRAALLAGGVAALAHHLGAPEGQVRRWIEGEEEAPQEVFLAALELVLIEIERRGNLPS